MVSEAAFLVSGSSFFIVVTVEKINWIQERRHSNRGCAYMFAPMVNFNEMAEVGETPP